MDEAVNLIEYLVRELGITPTQAEGGAGLLLGLAQNRLDGEEFMEIADSIPAISDIIDKAPRFEMPPPRPMRAVINRWFGGLGDLSVLVKPFEGLGIDKVAIVSFVSALSKFFSEKGGGRVESSLQSVLR